jgi:TIR domain
MKMFISYSHADKQWLDLFHKHLAQLQRDHIISSWTDEQIMAGDKLNQTISSSLNNSDIFIALLSPDYIASKYCYEKEFEKALELQGSGKIMIVPVIVEPCDWLDSPFKEFKALPNDGKPVSTWENKNTAFLGVVQNIRNLISNTSESRAKGEKGKSSSVTNPRNYRVQKDFDTIEKMEFLDKTFHEIKELIKRFIDELLQLDNIKVRPYLDSDKDFECLLVNRNKINTESQLKISTSQQQNNMVQFMRLNELQLSYSISNNNRPSTKGFSLLYDQYHLMWTDTNSYSGARTQKELSAKDMANQIWSEWLESVGIF